MQQRDDLEGRATVLVDRLFEELVGSAEDVDFRAGTYLLAAVAAELGQRVQGRCWDLARTANSAWELAAADADTLITGAWRCMETVAQLTERRL